MLGEIYSGDRKMFSSSASFDKNIYKKVMVLAFPAMMESFFNALAGLIDSYMVSRLGPDAVAAIGLCTQPKFIGLAFYMSLGIAVSALVARRMGQNEREQANSILVTSSFMLLAITLILTSTVLYFVSDIIRLCGSSPQTHDMAVTYFSIIAMGYIANGIQIVFNSAQRGVGNTRITMRTNMVSSLVNIIFNYLLIEGHFGFPALGIRGAALATVLGTAVAAVMSFISVIPYNNYVSITFILKNRLLPSMEYLRQIIRLAYSMLIEQILMRTGFMATALMAASMGNYAMAAHQVGMNLLGISFSLGDGLQAASVTLIGFSLGQNRPDNAKLYTRCCQKIGAVVAIAISLIYFFFGRYLYQMFFTQEEIVSIGMKINMVAILLIFFQISQVIYFGCLRGAGDTGYTAVLSIISCTFIRTIVGYVMGIVLGLGITGVWLGILADQVGRFTGSYFRFKQGKWVNIKI